MRSFTRISARLAQIKPELRDKQDRQPGDESDGPDLRSAPSKLPAIILFGSSHSPLPPNVRAYTEDQATQENARVLGQPLNVTIVPESAVSHETYQHVIVARAGDTLSSILSALAVLPADQDALLAAFLRRRWFSREGFSGGEIITVIEEARGSNASPAHVLKITVKTPNIGTRAVARTDDGRYEPVVPEQAKTKFQQSVSTPDALDLWAYSEGTLRNSLYALAQSNRVDEGIIAEVMRLCAHDFDLDQPLGATDAADILYAPDELGQPELVFVALKAQGKTRRYYRFKTPDDGSTDFYDEDGHSVTKFLLRKPVVDGRLGDGFGWRVHPILHDCRFHEGVDYAAPYGSPVAAAGAGVEIMGREWGYGKYVRIRHDLSYETTYAHIAGFPKGLKVGDRVRQGETIAYVGSTGLSTGPHLYYEVWINGRRVNPLRIRLAGGRLLRGDVLKRFQQSARRIDQLINVPAEIAARP